MSFIGSNYVFYALAVIAVIGVIYWFYKNKRNSQNQEKSLYNRLGGIFPIAAVVDKFSDALLINPVVGVNSQNPQLREWSRNKASTRLQGLKFMRTLWLADVAGGPFRFHRSSSTTKCPFFKGNNNSNSECRLDLQAAHCPFKITSSEFDAVADELNKTLISFNVPDKERNEVLNAFAAHKNQVIACSI